MSLTSQNPYFAMDRLYECIVLGSILLLSVYLIRRLQSSNMYLNSLPWVGLKNERFSMIRSSFRQLFGSEETLNEGYEKYSRNGKAFVMSDPTFQPQVMLPQEHIKWFMDQPESLVSHWSARQERHALEYLQIGVDFASTTTFLTSIIANSLSPKRMGIIQPDMVDEVRRTVDREFGTDDTEWQDFNAQDVMARLISTVGSRVLFGFPLCRDAKFLHAVDRFILFMGIGTIVIGQLPPFLIRPVIGGLLRLPVMYYKNQVLKALAPIVEERIVHLRDAEDDPMREASTDFLTQSIKKAIEGKGRNDSYKGVAYVIEQFSLLTFAAISPASLGATNLLLDIISADPKLDLYSNLRKEADETLTSARNWEDPVAIKKLALLDSTIRESLRTNPTLVRGLLRGAVDANGLTLPDGSHVPSGSWIGAPVLNIHNDERFYENPLTFDPYRFVEVGSTTKNGKDPRTKTNIIESGQVNDTFLSFGGGHHACPGRWYVVHMFKILFAYIVINYDVKYLSERPKRRVVGDANVPSISTVISVRRRNRLNES